MPARSLNSRVAIGDHPHMPIYPQPDKLGLRLFGEPAILLGDDRTVALERRAAALLALAALEPGISRLRVARLLWPDSSDPRRNLRQQLLRFRQQFGHPLVEGDSTLNLGGSVLVDSADDTASAPLLASQHYEDCDEFEAWLSLQREAARSRRIETALQQIASSEAAGDVDTALTLAEQLLRADPDSEIHYRTLMRLHYLRGDISQAQAAYERLLRHLRSGVGAQPSAETEQLAQALRVARLPTAPVASSGSVAARRSVPVTLLRPPRMIGRSRELAALADAWRAGRAALLLGEPGLGKSRLLAEFAAGRQVLIVQGRPGDAGVPYATLARLLRKVLERSALDLPAPRRTELARLLPELAPSLPLPADGQRLLLHGAVEAVLAQAQLQGRSLDGLVIDDLHFADEASVEMVQSLIGAESLHALRWALAQRPGEGTAAAGALRSTLEEAQTLTPVALAPLTEAEMAEMIDALGLPELNSAQLAPTLVRHTGGNPLFALETLKQGLAGGLLQQGRLPSPVNVGALIERRLKQLSDRALALARVAAIAGVDFSIALAEEVMGARAVDMADAWGELEAAQVLREEAFAHDLVQDAVLRGVPAVVARRVHGQCARWLGTQGVEPARVAWHWRHGGVPAEAGRAFVAAAVRAGTAARLQEEAALYEHAAQAFAEANLDEERFEALVGRVRSLSEARFDGETIKECRALLDAARTDAQRLRAHSELAGLLTERSEPRAALEAGQAALALAEQLGAHEWQVRTACHMATALCRLGRADEAVALLAPLRAWVDAQPNDTLRMLWHGEWGASVGNAGRLREAVAAYDVALDAARRLGQRDGEGRLLLNCSVTLRQSGQFDRALGLSRQGRALSAAETEDPSALPVDALILARDEAECGQFSSAISALEPALTAFEQRGTGFWVQACRMVLLRLWLDLGQYARAVALLKDEPDDTPAWLQADRRLLQLELAQALRQPTPAGVLEEALALSDAEPQRGPSLKVRALRALPPAQVLALAPDLAKTLAARERFGALLALRVHVARAALDCGQTDLAVASARAAMALFKEGYSPESMYRPEAHLVAWRVLTEAGASVEAAAALKAAADWVQGHALPHVPVSFIDSFLNRNPINRELRRVISRQSH